MWGLPQPSNPVLSSVKIVVNYKQNAAVHRPQAMASESRGLGLWPLEGQCAGGVGSPPLLHSPKLHTESGVGHSQLPLQCWLGPCWGALALLWVSGTCSAGCLFPFFGGASGSVKTTAALLRGVLSVAVVASKRGDSFLPHQLCQQKEGAPGHSLRTVLLPHLKREFSWASSQEAEGHLLR